MERLESRRTCNDRRRAVNVGLAILSCVAFIAIPLSWTAIQTGASSIAKCTSRALQVMVDFDGPRNGNGAVFFQDVSSQDCSLTGQPTLTVFDQSGRELNHSESRYQWTPALPKPTGPIILAAGSDTQDPTAAVVEFDWCGFASGSKRFDITFGDTQHSFVVRSIVEGPAQAFISPKCSKGTNVRLAVDYVRGMGSKGIAGLPQTVRVDPSTRLHNNEKVLVSVAGFWPGGKFWLSECAAASDARSDTGCGVQLAAEPFGLASYTGSGSYYFVVHTRAATKPLGHQTVLCKNKCVLTVVAPPGLGAYAPLEFP